MDDIILEKLQCYVDDMTLKRGKLSSRDVQAIADHFGGTLTSGGKYIKIDGQEYAIYMEYATMTLKVRHMTWTHGDNWKYAKPY